MQSVGQTSTIILLIVPRVGHLPSYNPYMYGRTLNHRDLRTDLVWGALENRLQRSPAGHRIPVYVPAGVAVTSCPVPQKQYLQQTSHLQRGET